MIDHEELRTKYLSFLAESIPKGYDKLRPRTKWPQAWQNLPVTQDGIKLEDFDPERVWISSDLHFGHKNIIRYCDRPFEGMDDMRESLIARHNACVHPTDVWVFTGDFGFMPDAACNEVLDRMNGYKVLVVGNHDLHKKKLKKLNFLEVHDILTLELEEHVMVFSHFPIEKLESRFGKQYLNVHGHVHNTPHYSYESPTHFNACCEHHDYFPVTLKYIIDTLLGRSYVTIQNPERKPSNPL